jgi:hypothetical protein
MTQAVTGWLPGFLGPVGLYAGGTLVTVARPSLNFVGFTAVDDTVNNRTNFTLTPTLAAPTFSGIVTYQGTRMRRLDVPGEVQTSSTTATVVASFTMLDLTVCSFEYHITCARQTATSKGGTYRAAVTYRRNGAGPTIVGANVAQTDQETTAGDGVAWNVNGNVLEVKVTAADTDPRNWGGFLRVQEMVATV